MSGSRKVKITSALIFLGKNYSQAITIGSSQTNKPSIGDTLKNGLVGWWTFDGADVTAVMTTDKSGNGKDGTRVSVTPVSGKVGQAMTFNGSSSLINLGSPASLAFTSTSFFLCVD